MFLILSLMSSIETKREGGLMPQDNENAEVCDYTEDAFAGSRANGHTLKPLFLEKLSELIFFWA